VSDLSEVRSDCLGEWLITTYHNDKLELRSMPQIDNSMRYELLSKGELLSVRDVTSAEMFNAFSLECVFRSVIKEWRDLLDARRGNTPLTAHDHSRLVTG